MLCHLAPFIPCIIRASQNKRRNNNKLGKSFQNHLLQSHYNRCVVESYTRKRVVITTLNHDYVQTLCHPKAYFRVNY
jgi:hypothetical protein